MEALVLSPDRRTAIPSTITIPLPGPNEIQVKVHAIALNPVDALYTANPLGQVGRTVGSDFAGTVSALGSGVSTIHLNQRVAGFLQGACSVNERPGAFAEYLVVPYDLVWTVPEEMRFTEAATVSLCALTAAQALFSRLGLPALWTLDDGENKRGEPELKRKEALRVVIYGASTSVALYAAQLINRSSLASGQEISIYGVASSTHHDILKQEPYNYTAVVDYKSKTWPADITSLSGGEKFDFAFDCIFEGSSVPLTSSLLAPTGKIAVVRSREGKAWTYDPETMPSEPLYGAVWAGLGEEVHYQGMTVPASAEAREFAVQFYEYISRNPLVPNQVRSMPGGLERIQEDGFALLGSGSMDDRNVKREEEYMKPIRREKLVYELIRA